MKAAYYEKFGTVDTLNVTEQPSPTTPQGKRFVNIKVRAAGVNPVDRMILYGFYPTIMGRACPSVLGQDFVGELLEDVTELSLKQGDKIYGMIALLGNKGRGSFATEARVGVDEICALPQNVNPVGASTLPLVMLTVMQAFVRAGIIDDKTVVEGEAPGAAPGVKGRKIFIQAGSGGLGTCAIQFASHLGLEVHTNCSAQNHPLVKSLGADFAYDYHEENWQDPIKGKMDYVMTSMGGPSQMNCEMAAPLLKKKGNDESDPKFMPVHIWVANGALGWAGMKKHGDRLGWLLGGLQMMGQVTGQKMGFGKTHAFIQVVVDVNPRHLRSASVLVANRSVKPVLEDSFELEKIQDALNHVASGHCKGKVAVRC
eukprot:Clim_evm13s202 gene=Clim_evmTU13s202